MFLRQLFWTLIFNAHMPLSPKESRWSRLERYCRWRQRRLRIDRMPNDAVLNVISFLSHEDVCALLNALYSVPRMNIQSRREALLVPCELRAEWLHGAAWDNIVRIVYSIGETAFFHARDCTRVCAHVDWSVFTGHRMPVPLCVYEWAPMCSARVEMNEHEAWRVIRDASATGRTAVTIALYRYRLWGNQLVLQPDPCHRMTYHVFPYFLASEFHHLGFSWKERCDARFRDTHPPCVVTTSI